MTNKFDLLDLERGFVGVQRLFDALNRVPQTATSYPPYNIIKLANGNAAIQVAVAGFDEKDLKVEVHNGDLIITGQRTDEEEVAYQYRGIANRSFKRVIGLVDYAEVENASLKNGILTVEVVVRLPEELQPKAIPILTK